MKRYPALAFLATLALALPAFGQPPVVYPTGAKPSSPQALASAAHFLPDGKVGAPAQFARIPERMSFWGNNRVGDCVSAEEAIAKIAAHPHVFVTEAEVMRWATEHGVRDGATLSEVLDYMRSRGMVAEDGKEYRDGDKFLVNYKDRANLADAIFKGPVKIAVSSGQISRSLNQTGGRSGWAGVNWAVDNVDRFGRPKADHCVGLLAYGPAEFLYAEVAKKYPGVARPPQVPADRYGYVMFTWNSLGFVDEQSLKNVTVEAWVREPTTAGFPEPRPAPPGLPAAPGGLTAVAISPSQVRLTWADNSDNETGFRLERATDPEFTQGVVASSLPGENQTFAVAIALKAGTTYYFRVRAVNAAGVSAPSNTASATPSAGPPVDPPAPPAPHPWWYYLIVFLLGGLGGAVAYPAVRLSFRALAAALPRKAG